MPPRVAHIIAPAPVGGAEAVVRALSAAALRAGRKAWIVALLDDGEGHPFVAQARADGTPVIEVRCGRRRYLAEARRVGEALREHSVELVHTHVYHADLVGYLAARRAGLPVVATLHGYAGGDARNRFYEWLDRKLLARFDAVLCVSEAQRNRMRRSGCSPERLALVPNGHAPAALLPRAEARARLGLPAATPAIGWVGRLSVEKGADLFVEALARLGPGSGIGVVIGEGAERERVEARARALGLGEDRLRFAGFRGDAPSLLAAFDAVVISSRTEGLPVVLLEAIAAGTPVAAFAVGGVPDLLGAASGWLAPAGDVAALARALASLLADPGEAQERAREAGRILASRFGVERWLEQVDAAHARALAGAR
ncbi:MAG TPA: glycosyltransferase [Myxococcota bacterium]|jgi:glycosyltransferase involved in cell wall biosynthesis